MPSNHSSKQKKRVKYQWEKRRNHGSSKSSRSAENCVPVSEPDAPENVPEEANLDGAAMHHGVEQQSRESSSDESVSYTVLVPVPPNSIQNSDSSEFEAKGTEVDYPIVRPAIPLIGSMLCKLNSAVSSSEESSSGGTEDEDIHTSDMNFSRSSHSSDSESTVYTRQYHKAYIRKTFWGKSQDACDRRAAKHADNFIHDWHKRHEMVPTLNSDTVLKSDPCKSGLAEATNDGQLSESPNGASEEDPDNVAQGAEEVEAKVLSIDVDVGKASEITQLQGNV